MTNMVPIIRLYKMLPPVNSLVILLAIVLAGFPAFADSPAPDLHFIGRYDFAWSGIPLASAELQLDETRDSYSVHLELFSRGIVNIFTRHRSDTTVKGDIIRGAFRPRLYESHYWTKNKPRHIRVAFDARGVMTEELVEPPEDRTERPEVPHSLKDGTIDPLTLILAVPRGSDKPHVFDGKRLWEGTAEKGAPAAIRAYDGSRDAVPYQLSRKALSGLTRKEMLDYLKGEPVLTFYFSADDRHIPLYTWISVYLGRLQGALARECKTWDECRIE